MRGRRSRQEVSLARLLARCQELAATSADLGQEWRLPKFLEACEELLAGLPRAPDPAAPSAEALLGYRSALDLLAGLLPEQVEEVPEGRGGVEREVVPAVPMPQGTTSRDTVSRQIYQRAAERQHGDLRQQLLGGGGDTAGSGGGSLDSLLVEPRERQERVAEEMIALTQSLKEQTMAAGALVRGDTARLGQAAEQADSNLAKLGEETKRVGEFSARGSCRCCVLQHPTSFIQQPASYSDYVILQVLDLVDDGPRGAHLPHDGHDHAPLQVSEGVYGGTCGDDGPLQEEAAAAGVRGGAAALAC